MSEDQKNKIGLDAILSVSGIDREAKAYAFLYAAFKRTEVGKNPVRDALDCLTPFIANYMNSINGNQILAEGIQRYLSTTFGFNIPIYAIEQMMPGLEKAGFAEYNKKMRIWYAKRHESRFDVSKSEIETDFDDVVRGLRTYAGGLQIEEPPASRSWDEALIAFLKSQGTKSKSKFVNIKGALLEPSKIEEVIVANYISKLSETDRKLFDQLTRVFMGVLIEEFISSISEIGSVSTNNPLHIFYDTSVILRLLGCSGKLLKRATDELNRYLQDLGFKIHYFSGNESEVAGILDTIIYIKDSGKELEGETAEAIASGEITLTDIRMLQNAIAERLAGMNVFSSENIEKNIQDNAKYQIDERGLSEYLRSQALSEKKTYGVQNSQNDAGYVGSVMRLRKALNTRDFINCGYVFVTTNKFLARCSRKYLIDQRAIRPQHCPPVLSVGQVATIAWLIKDQKLEPEQAGRELLSNCFAAVRPDQEWFRHFREGIESVKGGVEGYASDPKGALVLQAARRIAQEQSFGDSLVVRQLNMAEIINRAEAQIEKTEAERRLAISVERELAERELNKFKSLAESEKKSAVENAVQSAIEERHRNEKIERLDKARQKAEKIVRIIKMISISSFVIMVVLIFILQFFQVNSWILWVLLAISSFVSVVSFADMVGMKYGEWAFSRIQRKIADYIAS